MPDDILDAAQKKIDSASQANTTGDTAQSNLTSPSQSDTPSDAASDTETVSSIMESVLSAKTGTPNNPPPQTSPPNSNKKQNGSEVVKTTPNDLTQDQSKTTDDPPSPSTDDAQAYLTATVLPPPKSEKRSHIGPILAVLLFLLITIPVGIFYVSQSQQLADFRGRAQVSGPYPGQPCSPPNAIQCFTDQKKHWCDPATNTWSTGGDSCKGSNKCVISNYFCEGTQCMAKNAMLNNGTCGNVPSTNTNCNPRCDAGGTTQCQNGEQNRDQGYWLICECANGCSYKTDTTPGSGGSGWVCDQNCRRVPIGTRPSGSCTQIDWVHNESSDYCGVAEVNCGGSCQTGATPPPGSTSTPTPPPASTATPTPPPEVLVCKNIKIYKDDQVVSDPSKLMPGDAIVAAVNGENAIKAHIRLNGAAWVETDTTNDQGEFIESFTIPTTATKVTLEAEVTKDGTHWE